MKMSRSPLTTGCVWLAAHLIAACGGASAAPFLALSYEAGGGLPGFMGAGFSVSSGGFFTAGGAGTNISGGTAASMTAANEFEFDSHFSLDGFGPSARNRTVTPTDNSTMTLSFYNNYGPAGLAAANYNELEGTIQGGVGPFNVPGASFVASPGGHIGDEFGGGPPMENLAREGIAVSPPPVSSHFAPLPLGGRSNLDGVFVGRFTVVRGAAFSGGIFLNVVSPGGFFGAPLTLGAPAVVFNTINGPQPLILRAYRINLCGPVNIQNPSDATAAGVNSGNPFGPADVYDVWVQVDPPLPTACPRFHVSEAAFTSDTCTLSAEGFEGATATNTRAPSPITTTSGLAITITPSTTCPMRTRIGIYNLTGAAVSDARPADGVNFVFVSADPGTSATGSCPAGNSSTLTINLPMPVTAFGVHISDWGDFIPGATLTLSTNTGITRQVALTPPALPNGNAMFIGITRAPTPFSQVVLTSTAIGELFGIDRILFGEAPCGYLRPPPPPVFCPGDADGDGAVTFADITSVLENWAFMYPGSTGPGDANDDGAVSFTDITEVLTFWGAVCP